jgi:hypothetical protein
MAELTSALCYQYSAKACVVCIIEGATVVASVDDGYISSMRLIIVTTFIWCNRPFVLLIQTLIRHYN